MDVKMDDKTTKIILYIVIGLIVVWFAYKLGGKILDIISGIMKPFQAAGEGLGLSNTTGDNAVEYLFEHGAPLGSPWNGLTWLELKPDQIPSKWVNAYLGTNVPGTNTAGVRKVPKSVQYMTALLKEVDNTTSVWGDDFTKLFGIYKREFTTQAEFSYYVWFVQWWAGLDLLEWLQGEGNLSGNDRFSNEEIYKIITWLRTLKKY